MIVHIFKNYLQENRIRCTTWFCRINSIKKGFACELCILHQFGSFNLKSGWTRIKHPMLFVGEVEI